MKIWKTNEKRFYCTKLYKLNHFLQLQYFSILNSNIVSFLHATSSKTESVRFWARLSQEEDVQFENNMQWIKFKRLLPHCMFSAWSQEALVLCCDSKNQLTVNSNSRQALNQMKVKLIFNILNYCQESHILHI